MTAGDENKLDRRLKLTHELPQKDRLARSYFSCEQHQPFLGFDPVNQGRQPFQIKRVAVEEARVWGDTKWGFAKPKIIFKGSFIFLQAKKVDHFFVLLLDR